MVLHRGLDKVPTSLLDITGQDLVLLFPTGHASQNINYTCAASFENSDNIDNNTNAPVTLFIH